MRAFAAARVARVNSSLRSAARSARRSSVSCAQLRLEPIAGSRHDVGARDPTPASSQERERRLAAAPPDRARSVVMLQHAEQSARAARAASASPRAARLDGVRRGHERHLEARRRAPPRKPRDRLVDQRDDVADVVLPIAEVRCAASRASVRRACRRAPARASRSVVSAMSFSSAATSSVSR